LVRLRMKRTGTKNNICWRLVATETKCPRDGRNIEELGYYNAQTEPVTMNLKEDRIKYWISVGAQPSIQVLSLLKKAKISIDRKKK
jgi:small subunit ribosomal protein S16